MLTALALAFISLPRRASRDLFTPSVAQQIKLGLKAATQLRKQYKVLPPTDARVVLVRRVGQNLLATIPEKEPWKFSFDVLRSKEVNAFALPGGPTFVFTGLLDKLKTVDELAGVMGHEMTHVRMQHWAHRYAATEKRNLLLILGLTLLHANQTSFDLASVSNELIFNLPFSRAQESQADAGGFALMTAAGYNPQGMVDLFKLFTKLSGAGSTPAFLSDHPSDKDRIKRIQAMILKSNRSYPPQVPLDLPNHTARPSPIRKIPSASGHFK